MSGMNLTLKIVFGFCFTSLVGIAWASPTTKPAVVYPLDVCVIAGEKLGGMGEPVVETIDGREVKFCCKGCVGRFKKGGEASHKKMDDLIIAKLKDSYALKTCIVSGHELGDDTVNYVHRPTNQLVKFCCDGCIDEFKKAPEVALEKLAAAAK
jgi:hypothetical protein